MSAAQRAARCAGEAAHIGAGHIAGNGAAGPAVRGPRPAGVIRTVLHCCLCILLGVAVAAAESSVYSWTDERGTVHFSNTGPPASGARDLKRRVMQPHVPRDLATSSAEIPFVTLPGNLSQRFVPVVLEGARNRREVLMLVDTGAQITMIDEELADDLDVEHLQDAQIVGVSGKAPGWVGRLRSLRVGDEEVSQLEVMVGPFPGMRLLGMDILSALNLTVGQKALQKEK